jgi:phenylalanyl-tRNA synthetase beta chain
LEALGFHYLNSTATKSDTLQIQVPVFRRDITREIDLIEEIARLHGYDTIPATLPEGAATRGGESEESLLVNKVREACITAGLHETITYSFTSPRHFDLLRFPKDDARRNAIRIANPLSEELSVMRTTVLGNLMEALSRNAAHQILSVHLFELGAVFIPKVESVQTQPEERRTLGIAMMGTIPGQVGPKAPQTDFYTLKGVLEAIEKALGIHFTMERGAHPSLHPGRTGAIYFQGQLVGHLGEVHPLVAKAYDLPNQAYLLEIDLLSVLPQAGKMPSFKSLPRYPAISRDLALLVPVKVPAVQVEHIIQASAGEYLEAIQLFDVYQGKQVPDGFRSLAFSLLYRAADRTLTDAEVHSSISSIEAALEVERVQIRR